MLGTGLSPPLTPPKPLAREKKYLNKPNNRQMTFQETTLWGGGGGG